MAKDLQYYLDNPDETPTDPAVLAELANSMGVPGVDIRIGEQDEKRATSGEPDKVTDPKPAEETKQEPATKETAAEPAPKKEDEAPAGVATKDGKHIIPYAALESERTRRQAAETAVQDLSRQLEEMQKQLAKGTTQGDGQAVKIAEQAAELLSDEDLEALRTDFPAMGKMVDGFLATIGKLNSRIDDLTSREQVREKEAQAVAAKTVQDFIDAEPVLVHLQSTDPALWDQAVQLDNLLRGNPKFADTATRFAKVAEQMESLYGPFDGVVKAPTPPAKPAAPSVSTQDARKAVQDKLAASEAAPRSLSDLPAGEAPASTEMESLENATPAEIGARLLTMSEDQRAAFLSRL